jgi:Fe-S cluster biogenesis protein NfuA
VLLRIVEREDHRMKEKVEKVLEEIRPSLQADGGDIELVDIEDGVVKVRLKGSCAGCPMSQMTLAFGVERVLKEKVPEVKKVEAVPF